MWTFEDKGARACCLVPEITGLVQEMWRERWSKERTAPRRVFYEARCFRYERPQAGRYREFTQFGVEILGGDVGATEREAVEALRACLCLFGATYEFKPSVARGLSYYVDRGFEVECDDLGAQKQVAGGGRYAEGVGWAVGVDRLMLAEDRFAKRL